MKSWWTTLFEWTRDHFLTILAALLLGLVFTNVSQVSHILFQLPSVAIDSIRWSALGLHALVGLVLLVYGYLVIRVVPRFQNPITGDLGALARSWSRCSTGLGIVFLVVLVVFSYYHGDGPLTLLTWNSRYWLWGFGLAWLLTSAWLLIVPRLNVKDTSPENWAFNVLGRAFLFLLITDVLGEVMWWAIAQDWMPQLSHRTYTIPLMFHGLFTVLLAARVLDALQSVLHLPIRLLAVVVLLVIVVRIESEPVGRVEAPEHEQDKRLEVEWLQRLNERIDQYPDGPVIFVAGSGGGSRAALFTSLVLEALSEDIAVPGPTCSHHSTPAGGIGAPPFGRAGASVHPIPLFLGKRITLLSSVSGGSLASAHFTHSLQVQQQRRTLVTWVGGSVADVSFTDPFRQRRLKNSLEEELVVRMQNCAADFLDKWKKQAESERKARENESDWEPDYRRAWEADYQRRLDAWNKMYKFCESLSNGRDPSGELLWPVSSSMADDMCTDFMAPLLRGALVTWQERGRSVSNFWEERFHWQPALPRECRERPLLLLNATEVKRGTRLVIGFPALPRGLLFAQAHHPDPDKQKLQLKDELPRSLQDLQHGYVVSLAEGVRLSANFPWGFEVANAQGAYHGENLDQTHILDGGIVDNTGMDTLAHLLRGLHVLSKPPEGSQKQTPYSIQQHQLAKVIFPKLRQRGVFLIEIDSGARQSEPGFFARQFIGVTEPARAMEKTGLVSAHFNKEMFLNSEINALLAYSEEDRALGRQTFTCNHSENVMTAWALGPEDKAAVWVQFLVEREFNRAYLQNPDLTYGKLQQRACKIGKYVAQHHGAPKDAEGEKKMAMELQLEQLGHDTRRAQIATTQDAARRKIDYGQVQAFPPLIGGGKPTEMKLTEIIKPAMSALDTINKPR